MPTQENTMKNHPKIIPILAPAILTTLGLSTEAFLLALHEQLKFCMFS